MKRCALFVAFVLALPVAASAESKSSAPETTAPRPSVRADRIAKPSTVDPLARFSDDLRSRRFDDAARDAEGVLREIGDGAVLLDELTYRLVDAGAPAQAGRLLVRAYPFSNGSASQRALLLQRLTMIVAAGHIREQDAAALREPLDTPALRAVQAAFWADKDCDAVRRILGDMSPLYRYDDWMRLGDCSATYAPTLAQQAYARAHALQPGGAASRALGYQAYATGDYAAAMGAWRSIRSENLSVDDLMAAATTALAAADAPQASEWLAQYHENGGAQNRRYWSLVAQSSEARGDVDGAIAALEQVVILRPDSQDYLHLSRLSKDESRKLTWLGQAAALESQNASLQLDLAYALMRVNRTDEAIAALERAASIEPSNAQVQMELGYAYSRAGNLSAAERAFERAWQADTHSVAAAQELVYINQRLGQNAAARDYAEKVLDAYGTSASRLTGAQADTQFGLQRLHEDLGRRITVSMDGWSGTHVGTGTSASRAGDGFRSYSQIEGEVRLGGAPIRNGRTLAAYARVIGDGGVDRQALPVENRTLGVGLRWKPFGSRVFYVSAEQQAALDGPSHRDLLLRSSASLFNGGHHGDDWHASGSGWFAENLYLDGAHYIKAEYSAVTGDYRASYHRKLAGRQTVEPYAHAQITGVRIGGTVDRDVRGGVGTRLNLWLGGNRYNADPHKISIGVEYQQTAETYLPDTNGVFVAVGARW